jgi:hypothetical protein
MACAVVVALAAACGSILASAAAALGTDLLINADFDGDVSRWVGVPAPIFDGGIDFDGCSGSGAAHLGSYLDSAWHYAHASQCVATPAAGTAMRGRIHAQVDAATATVTGHVEIVFYDHAGCTGTDLQLTTTFKNLPAAGQWTGITNTTAVPDGAVSAQFTARFDSQNSFQVWLDRALYREASDIVVHDFELGDLCRWSSVSP